MRSPRKKIVKAAGLLFLFQIIEQATALLKQVMVASWFGTSKTMDSYLVAATIVGLIVLWVGLPIRQTVIPLFRHDLARRGEGAAWDNVSILFNNLFIILVLIVVVAEFAAPYLVAIVAPGFEADTASLATSLSQLTFTSVVFVGMGALLSQISFSYEKFFLPGVAGVVQNVVVIVGLVTLVGAYGIYGFAAAVVLGAFCQFVIQLPILWEKRKLYRSTVEFSHPHMREVGKLGFPLLISTGGNGLARMTDRIFASLLSAGSLSALAFAHRPISVLLEVLIQPFHTATLPHFAKLSANRDFSNLSRQLFHYVRIIAFVTFPVAVGVMLTAEDAVRVLYHRGAFDESSVRITSQALIFYALAIPAQAIMRIFRTAFFNLKDTWTPTKIALGRLGLKIVLSWLLVRQYAHIGLALAESLSLMANALLLFYFLPKELKAAEGWKTAMALGQTLAVCLAMAGVVYVVRAGIDGRVSAPLELVSSVILGIGVYGASALLLQMEASREIVRTLTRLATRFIPRNS